MFGGKREEVEVGLLRGRAIFIGCYLVGKEFFVEGGQFDVGVKSFESLQHFVVFVGEESKHGKSIANHLLQARRLLTVRTLQLRLQCHSNTRCQHVDLLALADTLSC